MRIAIKAGIEKLTAQAKAPVLGSAVTIQNYGLG
jgi:hypothetical protein